MTEMKPLTLEEALEIMGRNGGMLALFDRHDITSLPDGLNFYLTKLWLENCSNITVLPADMRKLSYLHLDECPSIKALPENMTNLRFLEVVNCPGITDLPHGLPKDCKIVMHGLE